MTSKAEVMKAEDARNEALPKGDVAALEKIYADDLVYTNARGETLTKTAASRRTQGPQAQLRFVQARRCQVTTLWEHGHRDRNQHFGGVYNGKVSTHSAEIHERIFQSRRKVALCGHTETPMVQ